MKTYLLTPTYDRFLGLDQADSFVFAAGGNDMIGDSMLQSHASDDVYMGANGNDGLMSAYGHDVLLGGPGNDCVTVFGTADSFVARGGAGYDILVLYDNPHGHYRGFEEVLTL